MSKFTKVIIATPFILLNLIAAQLVYAEETKSPTQAIVLKPSDIKFKPAPGFPKGALITLIRGDLSKPVPYTIRFKLPSGFVIPSHWHTLDEEVTVLSGILNVGTGDKVEKDKSTALPAGGFQIVPANLRHWVWAEGDTEFQVDGMGPRTTVFVNPKEWTDMITKSNQ